MENLSGNSNESNIPNTEKLNSSAQEKKHIPLAERAYLKILGAKMDISRAGQSFVMSFPKPSEKPTSFSKSSDSAQSEQDQEEFTPEK